MRATCSLTSSCTDGDSALLGIASSGASAVVSGRAPYLLEVARQGEGSNRTDDSIDLPTREGQHIRQDISVTYNTPTPRQGRAARATPRHKTLGYTPPTGANAPPSEATSLAHAKGSDAATATVARVVKVDGERVAQVGQPGLGATSVVLVLGSDFKGLASGVALPTPAASRPPKPTAATRDLPAWDPRPC